MLDFINKANIDKHFVAIQTAAATVITQVIGRLGHFSVSLQTTVILSAVAAKVSDYVLQRETRWFKYDHYVAIPVGVLAGVAVNKFFYPATALTAVIDVKGFLILSAALLAVRLVRDFWPNLKAAEEGAVKGFENQQGEAKRL